MKKSLLSKEVIIKDLDGNVEGTISIRNFIVFIIITCIITAVSFLYYPTTALSIILHIFIIFCNLFFIGILIFILISFFLLKIIKEIKNYIKDG